MQGDFTLSLRAPSRKKGERILKRKEAKALGAKFHRTAWVQGRLNLFLCFVLKIKTKKATSPYPPTNVAFALRESLRSSVCCQTVRKAGAPPHARRLPPTARRAEAGPAAGRAGPRSPLLRAATITATAAAALALRSPPRRSGSRPPARPPAGALTSGAASASSPSRSSVRPRAVRAPPGEPARECEAGGHRSLITRPASEPAAGPCAPRWRAAPRASGSSCTIAARRLRGGARGRGSEGKQPRNFHLGLRSSEGGKFPGASLLDASCFLKAYPKRTQSKLG